MYTDDQKKAIEDCINDLIIAKKLLPVKNKTDFHKKVGFQFAIEYLKAKLAKQ
jgi:hypothetical protein